MNLHKNFKVKCLAALLLCMLLAACGMQEAPVENVPTEEQSVEVPATSEMQVEELVTPEPSVEEVSAEEALAEETVVEESEEAAEEPQLPFYFMKVDGVRYNMPFAVSELEIAGFDLTEYADTILEPGAETHLWLVKNGIKYSFNIRNQKDTASNVKECMVYLLALDVMDCPKCDVTVLEGIGYGTDVEEVLAVYETYGTRTQERDDGVIIYRIALNESLGQCYRIDVSTDGKACYFEVHNQDSSELYSVVVEE